MRKEHRELLADWLIVFGSIGLFLSLFLAWSHQFSPAFVSQFGGSAQLHGVPRNPTAWQVYSTADVLIALVAVGLLAVALAGGRGGRIAMTIAALGALAFTLHALASPPTNGATIFAAGRYVPSSPGAGVGETLALLGLTMALAGLGLGFTAE